MDIKGPFAREKEAGDEKKTKGKKKKRFSLIIYHERDSHSI